MAKANKATEVWPPRGTGGPPTKTRPATREWPPAEKFAPRLSGVVVAPGGMITELWAPSPHDLQPPTGRGQAIIWETFFSAYDEPPQGDVATRDRWVPGGLFAYKEGERLIYGVSAPTCEGGGVASA